MERDHPTDQMSTNAEDSEVGDEEERLQTGSLLGLGRSARPMGRGRSFDDDGRSFLPLFRLTHDVNRATRGYSRRADADETNQQERRLRETDAVRRSASSVSGSEVRTLLASRNQHDDVRPTEHGHAIQMLRGTAGRRSYDSSTRKMMDVDFGCPRYRATWRSHHDR